MSFFSQIANKTFKAYSMSNIQGNVCGPLFKTFYRDFYT